MYRTISSTILIFSLAVLLSCSGAGNTAQQSDSKEMEVEQYPSWYSKQKFVSGGEMMSGYATAIASDSAEATAKAVSSAESQLRSSLSAELENIRSEAVVELGSESGLDAPRFLIALRKADKAVDDLVETENTEVNTVKEFGSYRGFAEVKVPKNQLIERIGKRLGGYEKAWNAMKESEAFNNF